jgi:hypothetical protein
MKNLRRYIKKADQFVIAVQLNLDTDGFTYDKWGSVQKCKKGDWLVNNAGDTYTVDGEVFAKTYRQVEPGKYVKSTAVWAKVALSPGHVKTIEGVSHYAAGDYIVYNNRDGTDGYCISAEKFESMYELGVSGQRSD